ncbi:hypothetical protein HF086_003556 [Spodoptera exigua]|uniref:Transcription factor Tfb2 C-terminal domain-containing protein n=1 Tax=Spodoptera exigua TaxID=7107 RepID=A0A922MKL9_SPOEX|nr:hypothetical protein HF086_003556 [Spodoptera exigua]
MLKSETGGIRTTSMLPPTVVDQIKLWETERNRFTYTEGVVYNQFLSQVPIVFPNFYIGVIGQADFVVLRDYAKQQGVLTWQNERSRTMVVTRHGHDDVKKFWKRYSKSS